MNVTFYNLTDDRYKLNKTLSNGYTLQNVFFKKNSISEINPYLILKNVSLSTYNYCYISDLNKYYFIDSITVDNAFNVKVELKLDVLMTYKTIIEKSTLNIIECDKEYINVNKADSIKNDSLILSKIDIDIEGLFEGDNLIMVVKK